MKRLNFQCLKEWKEALKNPNKIKLHVYKNDTPEKK